MTQRFASLPESLLISAIPLTVMLTTCAARADSIPVNFAKNAQLVDMGISVPNGPFVANNSFGTAFDITPDANGNNIAYVGGSGTSDVLNIPVSIPDATDVYTLLNGFNPYDGYSMTLVDFYGTGGAFQYATLVNGTDVRDFNNYIYATTINGTTTQNAYAGPGPDGPKVIDEQHFSLNSSFAGQTLTDITITNVAAISGDHPDSFPILMGMTVNAPSALSAQTAVPESAPLALLALGLPCLLLAARRRAAR